MKIKKNPENLCKNNLTVTIDWSNGASRVLRSCIKASLVCFKNPSKNTVILLICCSPICRFSSLGLKSWTALNSHAKAEPISPDCALHSAVSLAGDAVKQICCGRAWLTRDTQFLFACLSIRWCQRGWPEKPISFPRPLVSGRMGSFWGLDVPQSAAELCPGWVPTSVTRSLWLHLRDLWKMTKDRFILGGLQIAVLSETDLCVGFNMFYIFLWPRCFPN